MQQALSRIKPLLSAIKPYIRWVVLGGTFFFVASTLRQHWQEVVNIQVQESGLACLAIALGVTLLSHIWSGWVWSWIFQILGQPVRPSWSVRTYLRTNIAKYLPGNVWHFYGRIIASKSIGISASTSTLSVLLEPLLMSAAALIVGLGSAASQIGIRGIVLLLILLGLHPKVLNPLLAYLGRLKRKPSPDERSSAATDQPEHLQCYPWKPLVGELGFVGLRSLGFLLTIAALQPISPDQIMVLISAFSVAWLLGLIIPGAPGGIGVFEATTISLLSDQFPAGLLLGVVAFYRLISTSAEVAGAGLAWLDERLDHPDLNGKVQPPRNVET